MSKLIAVMGDSQSSHRANMVRPGDDYPSRLKRTLRRRYGFESRTLNLGIAGDTTGGMVARGDELFRRGIPDLTIVWGGTNDAAASISQAQTQANLQALIKSAKFAAIGASRVGPSSQAGLLGGISVADVPSLPSRGATGQRYVVLSDSDTTGGVAADPGLVSAGVQLPTVTGSQSSAQTVWEYRNPLAGAYGWGRVATVATAPVATQRIAVLSQPYSVNKGDTPSTEATNGQAKPIRTAQAAAANAENVPVASTPTVVYIDVYAYMRTRIVGGTIYGQTFAQGTDPNFTSDTSIVPSTTYDPARSPNRTTGSSTQGLHHNEYGHWLVEQAILAGVASLAPQWLTTLAA